MSQTSLKIIIEEALENGKEEVTEITTEPKVVSKIESVADVLIPESPAQYSKIEEPAIQEPVEKKSNDQPII